MSYKPNQLRRWLLKMNAKTPINDFTIMFDDNIYKVTIKWEYGVIIFDSIFLPDEKELRTFISKL